MITGGPKEPRNRVAQHERAQLPVPHHPHRPHPQRGEGLQRRQQGNICGTVKIQDIRYNLILLNQVEI